MKKYILLVNALLLSTSVHGEITEALANVKGVMCHFCSVGIEKRIGAIKGVKKVEDIETKDLGGTRISFKEDNTWKLDPLVKQLKQSFKEAVTQFDHLRWIKARGRVIQDESGYWFKISKTNEKVFLFKEESGGAGESKPKKEVSESEDSAGQEEKQEEKKDAKKKDKSTKKKNKEQEKKTDNNDEDDDNDNKEELKKVCEEKKLVVIQMPVAKKGNGWAVSKLSNVEITRAEKEEE